MSEDEIKKNKFNFVNTKIGHLISTSLIILILPLLVIVPLWIVFWWGPFFLLAGFGLPIGESRVIFWSWGLFTGWFLAYEEIITEVYIPLLTYFF